MGRPKVDHSKTMCEGCGSVGDYHAKGLCNKCYQNNTHRRKSETQEEYLKRRRAYAKKWNSEHPEQYKANKHKWRLKRYGLSDKAYADLLEKQNGVCIICKLPPTEKRLSVDHCHKTGIVRGLLCNRCNLIVGDFETNDAEVFSAAQRYLNAFSNDNYSGA